MVTKHIRIFWWYTAVFHVEIANGMDYTLREAVGTRQAELNFSTLA